MDFSNELDMESPVLSELANAVHFRLHLQERDKICSAFRWPNCSGTFSLGVDPKSEHADEDRHGDGDSLNHGEPLL